MKITIIEANMTGLQHAYPNGIYCNIFKDIAGCNKVELYCSQEHFTKLNIEKSSFDFHPIKVLKPGKYRVLKFFLEYTQCKKIIMQSNSDVIIFLSSFPNVQYYLIKFNKFMKNKKVIIMTHGEVEGLILPGKWKFWSYPYWITKCFNLRLPDNISRIVLGESIKNNIRKIYSVDNIYFINQPRDGFEEENLIVPAMNKNLFGYIGNCLLKKGGNIFVKSAQNCPSAQFIVIGAFDLSDSIELPENLKCAAEKHRMLDQKLFNDSIAKITYACFPYPSDTYKFTASGAVLDAIRFLKPIVYIKNDYFDGILKDAGNIGYRCDNEDEFLSTIVKINLDCDENTYKEQVKNLKKLQNKFSISGVENQIKQIIERVIK